MTKPDSKIIHNVRVLPTSSLDHVHKLLQPPEPPYTAVNKDPNEISICFGGGRGIPALHPQIFSSYEQELEPWDKPIISC